jgi:hypothetical protein
MQIVRISQTDDREVWLEHRRGKATGSKAKGLKPLSRGTDRTPAGFWQLLAEKVAVAADGEKDIDRGHRLENEALELTAQKLELEMDFDPGMWIADFNEDIAVSPDAAEKGGAPTFAAEAKCLATANHLKYVIKDIRARKEDSYKAIDQIPSDAKSSYREQVVQYFVVNENLERLYFTLYDDRVAIDIYAHHVIVIERKDILDEIEKQKYMQIDVLNQVDALIAEMQQVEEA